MIKAVIFDFDGLIIDTESLWFEVYEQAAKDIFDIDIDIWNFAEAVGTSEEPYLQLIEEQTGYPIDRNAFLIQVRNMFQQRVSTLEPREGVRDYIAYAKSNNYKIGLATSSTYEWVYKFLTKFELIDNFDVIKTADIVGTKKPNPRVYLEVLKALEVTAKNAIAFEDSLNGFKAATGAGISTILVPNRLTSYIEFPPNNLILSSMGVLSLKEVIDKFQ